MLGYWLRKWYLRRYAKQIDESISLDNYKGILAYSETVLPEMVKLKFRWMDAVRYTIVTGRTATDLIDMLDRSTLAISNKASSLRFLQHPPKQTKSVDAFLTTDNQESLEPDQVLTDLTTRLRALIEVLDDPSLSKGKRSVYCRSVQPIVLDVVSYVKYLHDRIY